ncbi:MAG: gamma-glutamyltransferase [Atribacterota bacterium]|nr:gamma-glutamyltransferase [Atribacterota bacterium]MDD3031837.1 gamma-glutamyltransferase [Atribacterota bacterium]MDD4764670.1 gamma-glutamyltransferase [Atribacterota bacterium]MDI9597610.1 gamma-glutamyltransferase [Atribacterota bacterium]
MNMKKISLYFFVILMIFITITGISAAQDRHAPQDAISANGMVAAAHPLAAQTGVDILKKGGNAIDAAVATAFALNAVEPNASGIGGGGFMVIRFAETGEVIVLDYREVAPAAATKDMFASEEASEQNWAVEGGKAVGVPGTLMGLKKALDDYGTMTLEEVMSPAISYMENGFEITETFSQMIEDNYEKLAKWNDPFELAYLKDGLPLETGDVLIQEDLAKTYREILDKGIEHLYGGELGQKIVDAVQAQDGILELQDLIDYQPRMLEPITGNYRGYDIFSMPPPSSGGTHLIQILNIMENFDIPNLSYHGPTHISIMAEAMKMAFADRAQYMGDPAFATDMPLEGITSKEYAKFLSDQIEIKEPKMEVPAGEPAGYEHHSTSHISVIDAEGNAVALTQTINYFFGSGVVVPDVGVIMNNEMDDFAKSPDSPNAPEPGKIPLSSMSPTIIEKDGETFMVLGTPGGTRIFTAMTQIISNVIDFGMSMDEAIEAPRMHAYSSGGKAMPIYVESLIPVMTVETLRMLGNEVSVREAHDLYFGGAQGIMLKNGVLFGGGDSRRDGVAVGY